MPDWDHPVRYSPAQRIDRDTRAKAGLIASRVGGNIELINDTETGMLFPSGDVSALTSLLRKYVGDSELRRVHGLAARNRALNHFSIAAMVEKYQTLYESLARLTA